MLRIFTIVFGLLLSLTVNATEPNYCRYRLKFDTSGIVCSKVPFDHNEALTKIKTTEKLYKELTGVSTSADGVIVLIVPSEEINNEAFQSLTGERRPVVGRYFPEYKAAYITPEALKAGNTDLAHEIVHHLNAQNGIGGKADEELARTFESKYGSSY